MAGIQVAGTPSLQRHTWAVTRVCIMMNIVASSLLADKAQISAECCESKGQIDQFLESCGFCQIRCVLHNDSYLQANRGSAFRPVTEYSI